MRVRVREREKERDGERERVVDAVTDNLDHR